jgi:hypothetical protein
MAPWRHSPSRTLEDGTENSVLLFPAVLILQFHAGGLLQVISCASSWLNGPSTSMPMAM